MKIIGHRGAAGEAPENTLQAFETAVNAGVWGVEFDVHVVQSEIVVIHDDSVDRTTNGHGELKRFSIEALRNLDAGNGEKIPLLSEVLDLCEPLNLINIELKGGGSAAALDAYFRHVKPRTTTNLLVSSFDYHQLREFHFAQPDISVAPLRKSLDSRVLDCAHELASANLNLSSRNISADVVRQVDSQGLGIFVYTVNHIDEAQRLKDLGVAAVFTDYPSSLLSLQT